MDPRSHNPKTYSINYVYVFNLKNVIAKVIESLQRSRRNCALDRARPARSNELDTTVDLTSQAVIFGLTILPPTI